MTSPLLAVKNLSVDFTQGDRVTHAVSNASLELNKCETLALVGESGSGNLLPPILFCDSCLLPHLILTAI